MEIEIEREIERESERVRERARGKTDSVVNKTVARYFGANRKILINKS